MIFATDLDRTVVYSAKFWNGEEDVISIDKTKPNETSFLTNRSIELMKEIDKLGYFIPVTTRSKDDFLRLFPIGEFEPQNAVLANGGVVYVDGVLDGEWSKKILTKIGVINVSLAKAEGLIDQFFPKEIVTKKKVDHGLFWRVVINDQSFIPNIEAEIADSLNKIDYSFFNTGNKCYLIHNAISKWEALKYVAERLGEKEIIAAGDSLMDLEMVQKANIGITPLHGEIVEKKREKDLIVTEKSGVMAGEEILSIAMKHFL